ncbi:MAG: Hpt domain-containing protein [Hyphomicrobium sp.]
MQSSQSQDAAEAEPSVLNAALLDQYKARKNNLFERLVSAYLEEAPKFHQEIRRAAETNRLDEIRAGAHALKSCSYNLGAVRLSKICQELESAALAGSHDRVQQAMTRIGPECFEAEQALRSELFDFKRGSTAAPAADAPSQGQHKEWH